MYAIAFDLDTETLRRLYTGSSPNHAYDDICRVLQQHGFRRQQGSVYFGAPHVTPVHCILAVQDIDNTYPWFASAVRDIRMMRIEENNDLMPVLGQRSLFPKKAANE